MARLNLQGSDLVAYLVVKNWKEFQHYKDRDPPWIKMHRKLLNDYEFSRLQDASKLHLMLIWLLAAQFDGRIPNDAAFLQQKLSLKTKPDLKPLIDGGYLVVEQDAINALADCKQSDMPEAEAYKSRERGAALGVSDLTDLGVTEQHARDWLTVRKAKRAPLTDTVIQNMQQQASKAGISIAEAVEICAKKSWQGFNADWEWKQATAPSMGEII